MSNSGYIYVLINHSMENLVKVGKTTRDTESRAKELSSVTGVPMPFLVAFDTYFDDCSEAEEYIHKRLEQKGFRLSNNREFFKAPLKEVVNIIVEVQQLFQSKSISLPDNHIESEQKHGESAVHDEKEPWGAIEAIAEYHLMYGNFEGSYRLFKQALSMGSKNSYYPFGVMTLRGWGCLEDGEKGLELLQDGASNGDGRCCGELSNYYFYGSSCRSMGKLISLRQYNTAINQEKSSFNKGQKTV